MRTLYYSRCFFIHAGIISLFAAIPLLAGCNKSNTDSEKTNLLSLFAQSNSCPGAYVAPISSANVSDPRRSQYVVSTSDPFFNYPTCFVADSSATLVGGVSPSSQIASTGNQSISDGGVNDMSVEVTFTLSSGGYLEVIPYATVSGATATGPTVRISEAALAYNGSMFMSAPATTAGAQTTYCIDYDLGEAGMSMIALWPKACSSVTAAERGSMPGVPYMKMLSSSPSVSGRKIGFVLNKASLASFILGTRVYNAY